MVRISSSGDIVEGPPPSNPAGSRRQGNTLGDMQNVHRPRPPPAEPNRRDQAEGRGANFGGANPVSLFEAANTRLISMGFPVIRVVGRSIQPIVTCGVILALFLFGWNGVILLAMFLFIQQLGEHGSLRGVWNNAVNELNGTNERRRATQRRPVPSAPPAEPQSGPRAAAGGSASPWGGSGHRLGD